MDQSEEEKKHIADFLEAYGKLVDEYKIDFANFPQYIPNQNGTWDLRIITQPVDIKNAPVKSPFVEKA